MAQVSVHLPEDIVIDGKRVRWEKGDETRCVGVDRWEIGITVTDDYTCMHLSIYDEHRMEHVSIFGTLDQLRQMGQRLMELAANEQAKIDLVRDEQNARDALAIEDRAMAEVE